ncbi:MAG TPA: DUF4397 domain-containing protein [Actinoplanes sp.]|nr:DUF4397 domain-containing protein [Actinoplanes sp.]
MSIRAAQLRRLGGAAAALAAFAATVLIASPAGAADGDGYVRLAHLSPDTPAVDVYLKAQSGNRKEQTFPGVAYGVMSPYLRLPTGTYSVAMRPAGADPSTDPVLTTEVNVEKGAAYTVAGVGRYADLGLRVLRDDLELPDPGESKVRIIQASVRAPVLDIGVSNGPTIADGVQFATTTNYRNVKPGTWTLKVQPSGGGKTSTLPCTLGAGNVYSVLVLDDKGGGLKTQLRIDAQREGTMPLGAVATGGGGTQPGSHLPMALLFAAIAALLTGGTVVAIRRRPRAA